MVYPLHGCVSKVCVLQRKSSNYSHSKFQTLGIQAPSENGFMEPKYLAFRFGDCRPQSSSSDVRWGVWIPRESNIFPFFVWFPKHLNPPKAWYMMEVEAKSASILRIFRIYRRNLKVCLFCWSLHFAWLFLEKSRFQKHPRFQDYRLPDGWGSQEATGNCRVC